MRVTIALTALLLLAAPARAGLHYRGEQFAELPAQWRGFLLDQRALRTIAAPPGPTQPANPLRDAYRDDLDRLTALAARKPLDPNDAADLGALHLRFGQVDKAVEGLRAAQRVYPDHFALAANLGTAWQLAGDLDQAALALREAVRLAPARLKRGEEMHLLLVHLRRRQSKDAQTLDDLFNVAFVGDDGQYHPGQVSEAGRKKLPADAVAVVQRLALWLPADGRLLWLLGELANAAGDVPTAAAILDGAVTEFGMTDPELRRHRQMLRTAADALAKQPPAADAGRASHEQHAGPGTFHSARPLVRRTETLKLPPIRPDGLNPLPWAVLGQTTLDRQFKPTFVKHLRGLDGQRVALTGFMQPIGEAALEMNAFLLIEYPVGCWFCETPEATGIVLVELPEGKTAALTRSQIKVEGTLSLNATDPENFLYTVKGAKVGEPD